jgi:hypothetical protein
MTSACTFHGIIGVQDAMPYAMDKKRYWKMDGYVPLPLETETSAEDLHVSMSLLQVELLLQRMASTSSLHVSSQSLMMMKLTLTCVALMSV